MACSARSFALLMLAIAVTTTSRYVLPNELTALRLRCAGCAPVSSDLTQAGSVLEAFVATGLSPCPFLGGFEDRLPSLVAAAIGWPSATSNGPPSPLLCSAGRPSSLIELATLSALGAYLGATGNFRKRR